MTPKVSRFLRQHMPATPCLVLDVERVEGNYRRLRAALPLARVYYAVKANPAAPILDRLASLGSAFDAASLEEVQDCLKAGAPPDSISFGNTVKKESAIAEAYRLGVRMFAFDSEAELTKLARSAPGSRVYCRIAVDSVGAEWPLGRKFGCDPSMAPGLMARAAGWGLDPYGISFHVGSQQTGTAAYALAIERVAAIFSSLQIVGVDLRMVNLGGGFPIKLREDVPGIETFGSAIMEAMTDHFGNAIPEMAIEPGRFIVADAGVVAAEVVLVSNRSPLDPTRWVYLDIGRFGGLAETEAEAIRYVIQTPHDGGPTGPVAIAGPTCDSADILYERSGYRLPLALQSGDRIEILGAGAYVTTYASQSFNGFRPLAEHYI